MYCSSSQLLLIRLVGPPDVVAVVAVVAEAVEKQSSGLVPWFTSLSPHTSVPCPGVSSLRQEIPTQYWDSSVVLRGLQSVVFTAWSPAGEWDPWAQAVARKTCLAGSWGVVLNHTRSLAYTHLNESHFWCFLNHSWCFHTLGVSTSYRIFMK